MNLYKGEPIRIVRSNGEVESLEDAHKRINAISKEVKSQTSQIKLEIEWELDYRKNGSPERTVLSIKSCYIPSGANRSFPETATATACLIISGERFTNDIVLTDFEEIAPLVEEWAQCQTEKAAEILNHIFSIKGKTPDDC